jgi:hypothetical protein
MSKEALKLALEALEDIGDEWGFTSQRTVPKRKEAITAIKEALAESEPNYKKALEVWLDKTEWVQETVKPHELGMHRADVLKQRIEEASPQRTWVGLTDDELFDCWESAMNGNVYTKIRVYSAIEAKLKEKNNVL